MLNRIIDLALSNRWFILLGVLVLTAVGGYAVYTIPVEAFPDLTNNQVTVVTEAPSMPPTEVEQLVTYPIEQSMMGLPKQLEVRSLSKRGLSMVTVVFDDSVAFYFARQLVNERLQQVTAQLPAGVQPVLGLPATAFGELYQYTLTGPMSPMALKDIQEWQIKRQLRTVPGVSEVNTWGGEVKQYQVKIDPAILTQYGLTLHDVARRIADNNKNFGGGFIEHNDEQYTLRGTGRAETTGDLGNIVVLARAGAPVYLRNVADVSIGPMPRIGAVLRNGETVSGMVIMLKGENGKRLIEAVKAKISSLRLPAGVKITPFYDQSDVINGTIRTVKRNLFEGFVLVTFILLLFLGNLRAALITASIIPLSMLIGLMNMHLFGVSANLMSLGAIDFGMIVDGAVVMAENAVHHLQQRREDQTVLQVIRNATVEVARPMLFGVGIIISVYLPIFFLEGLEGRMFRPMAFTVCSALFGALLLALTAVPAFIAFAFPKGLGAGAVEKAQRHWTERITKPYATMLRSLIRSRWLVVSCALAVVATAIGSLFFLGTEFMPRLDEGSILIETRKLPGISLTDSVEISKRIERMLRAFPEVADIVIKIGRPDFATEAMGINEGDTYVLLRPMSRWTRFHSKDELIAAFDKELGKIPGLDYNFTQPMAMRVDETVSGVKADLAIKIFGDDFSTLDSLSQQVLRAVSSVRGAAEPQILLTSGVAELSVRVDRDALARYGLNVTDVQESVEAGASGSVVSEIIDGQKRYTVALHLPERYRSNPEAMGNVMLHAPNGEQVALRQVARIEVTRAAEKIEREEGQRRVVVMSNVRNRDLGSFVAEVRAKVEARIKLPVGYSVVYGGQFENQERATRRLSLIIPTVVAVIFLLLYLPFHSFKQAFLIIGNIPFALVGGIAALWLRGMNLNLSALIGFIALFGVAMLNGIVLVSSINQLRLQGEKTYDAVVNGARRRLRPVLMTACVASFGFLPMAISTSTGAEVQRPLATVVIGGLVTSTLLTLFLLPVLYGWTFEKEPVSPLPTVLEDSVIRHPE
ncbi:MAG TPA: CusA/CzcA family heavy metal efflux RND transporter [Edaphobacter sp.]|nr:CusA/CzcA family heavy metal efflux RND transporter [Edaphobacter sp.]